MEKTDGKIEFERGGGRTGGEGVLRDFFAVCVWRE